MPRAEKARKSKTFFHAFDTITHTISKIAAVFCQKCITLLVPKYHHWQHSLIWPIGYIPDHILVL